MKILRNLRFLIGIIAIKLSRRFKPLTAIINLTNRCNARCKHCYAAYFDRDTSAEMNTDQVKAVIRDLQKNGCLRISFGGGEPLLRTDIPELIDYVQKQGMSVTVNTNGILVPEYLNVLKKVDSLVISLDGRPEHHDILRGKDSAQKALKAIEIARKAGIIVYVNMVLNKYNLDDIDYILELAAVQGFKVEFNLIISNISGEQLSQEEYKPSNDRIRDALKHIIAKKRSGAPILYSAKAFASVLDCWKDFAVEAVIDGPTPKGMPRCAAAKLFCLIDADGTLWACPHLIGKIKAQNVLEVGVSQAWKLAQKHTCCGCYQIYHHEFGLLMNADPSVLWNYV